MIWGLLVAKNKQIEALRAYLVDMLNAEQDTHSELFEEVSERLGYSVHQPLKTELTLVHNTRIKIIEQILEKMKSL